MPFQKRAPPSRNPKQQETSSGHAGDISGIYVGWVVAAATALDALGTSVTQRGEPYDETRPQESATTWAPRG